MKTNTGTTPNSVSVPNNTPNNTGTSAAAAAPKATRTRTPRNQPAYDMAFAMAAILMYATARLTPEIPVISAKELLRAAVGRIDADGMKSIEALRIKKVLVIIPQHGRDAKNPLIMLSTNNSFNKHENPMEFISMISQENAAAA